MLQRYLDGIKVSGEYMITLLNRIINEDECCSSQDNCFEKTPFLPLNSESYLQEKISSVQERTRSYDFTGKRILVVDDMAINREIVIQLLKKTGAVTEYAEDGQVCLEMIKAAPPGFYDMVLMDIMMPKMDGLNATREIRRLSDKTKSVIPIIALTSNVSEKDRNAALSAGMDAFVETPIFVEKLFETMKQFMSV